MKSLKYGALWLAALLAVPVFADTSTSKSPAVPGTLNYVEGQASIGSQALNSKSAGSTELGEGQSLTTTTGKTEMLLTPGVFLRLGDHSSAKMVSSSLTNTQVAVNQGEAMVEVCALAISTKGRVLYAATHGRGGYSLPLPHGGGD